MIRLANELTIYQAAALKPQLVALLDGPDDLELDLTDVTEFDSAGYQLLALLRREAMAAGRPFRIAAMSGAVRELLDLFGVTDLYAGVTDHA